MLGLFFAFLTEVTVLGSLQARQRCGLAGVTNDPVLLRPTDLGHCVQVDRGPSSTTMGSTDTPTAASGGLAAGGSFLETRAAVKSYSTSDED